MDTQSPEPVEPDQSSKPQGTAWSSWYAERQRQEQEREDVQKKAQHRYRAYWQEHSDCEPLPPHESEATPENEKLFITIWTEWAKKEIDRLLVLSARTAEEKSQALTELQQAKKRISEQREGIQGFEAYQREYLKAELARHLPVGTTVEILLRQPNYLQEPLRGSIREVHLLGNGLIRYTVVWWVGGLQQVAVLDAGEVSEAQDLLLPTLENAQSSENPTKLAR